MQVLNFSSSPFCPQMHYIFFNNYKWFPSGNERFHTLDQFYRSGFFWPQIQDLVLESGLHNYFCRDHTLTMSFGDNQLQLCNFMNVVVGFWFCFYFFPPFFPIFSPRNVKAAYSGSPLTPDPMSFEINRLFFFEGPLF